MSLSNLVNNIEKQASNQSNNYNQGDPLANSPYTEEQIKEAYAAGRVTGAAFSDRIAKLQNQSQ